MDGHASTATDQGRAPGTRLDPSSALRRRPLLWLTLAFACGIFIDDVIQPAHATLLGLCMVCVLSVLAVVLGKVKSKRDAQASFAIGLFVALAGGMLSHALDARFLSPNDVTRRTPTTPSLAWLEGTVNEVRRNHESGRGWWTVDVEALGSSPSQLTQADGRVQIGVSLTPATEFVAEGDRIVCLTRLEAPAAATLPYGFDAARYLQRKGIQRVGVLPGAGFQRLGVAGWWRADLWARRWSGQWARRAEQLWGHKRVALPNALLLGRRDGIETSDKKTFQRVGTAHLLAISGLHLQLLAAAVWWLLGRMGWSKRRAGAAVILFSVSYMFMAGAQPPVVRATLMIALYLGGHWLYRAVDPLSVIATAALLILWWHPGALFMAGFQLSFFAVLALITLYPTLEAAWRSWSGFPEEWVVDPEALQRLQVARRVRQVVLVSFTAWLGTAPAVAWHMGYFSLGAVLMNLVVVPLTGLAMLGGGVALLFGPGWLGEIGLACPTLLLGFNRWASEFHWMGWEVPRPSAWLLLAYAAVCLWIWWGRGRAEGRMRITVLLPFVVVSLAMTALFREQASSYRVTVLDVNRGRSALVETPSGKAAMIDCGGEQAGRVLSAYLRKEGHTDLSLLVITEDSNDALGGAVELLRQIPVRQVILPRTAAPGKSMRALLEWLARHETPHGYADLDGDWAGPGDLKWSFCSDASGTDRFPRAGSEALGVRVAFPGMKVSFVPVRSDTSLRRLMAQAGDRLRCDTLRLYGVRGGRWPAGVEQLVQHSEARMLVAGEGGWVPEECVGFDLPVFAQSHGMRLLTLAREGSLRFGAHGRQEVLAFREGQWRQVYP